MLSIGNLSMENVLHELRDRGIRSVMVEGGAHVIASFLGTTYPDVKTRILMPIVDMVIITIGPMFAGCQATSYDLSKVCDVFEFVA
jgi:2,5-diamino-6-(ribosylamino)-4(3H)-pyrimidinone 5'-phosphate reductase